VTEPIVRRAYAKLNVFLRVLSRRDDGYHDIQTVILPLDLHDVVTVELSTSLDVVVTGPLAGRLQDAGGESLAARAARAWADATGHERGARITVDKRIPVAAGLGGGSADAAATILALDELHGTGLDRETQLRIAAAVGADVPALLHGGAVFADGRGDVVTPMHAVQTTTWVVAPASFSVRTPDAYGWWDGDGTTGPDPGAVVAALEAGNDEVLAHGMFNDLEAPVVARHPDVGRTIATLREAGALGAVMTGSGPTVVALARHLVHAAEVASSVPGAFVTTGPPRQVPSMR
jgi:4-diphosphocytidyl-2-C-methyl-D-erythritol kinase